MTEALPVRKGEIAEQMRLRSAPPKVMRLSRKALMVFGGVTALIVAGALGLALMERPSGASATELYRVGGPPPENLQSLPSDYASRGPDPATVPRLGPPLPGDLGGPIVAAQADDVLVAPPVIGGETAGPDAEATARETERQRLAQERETARSSGLFLGAAGGAGALLTKASAVMPASGVSVPPNAAPAGLSPAPSPYTIQAGTILSGALVTGLRSDLPGSAIGQITDDVYDSVGGQHLLIPKGSRLIGAYDAEVAFGQSRVLLVWSRLILPNGRSIALEAMPATDAQGYSGLQDGVDDRWGERLRTAALTTLMAVGASAGTGSGDNAIARALTQGVSGGVSAFGEGLIDKGLAVSPRLTIRPGFAFRVIVSHDLVLEPYGDPR